MGVSIPKIQLSIFFLYFRRTSPSNTKYDNNALSATYTNTLRDTRAVSQDTYSNTLRSNAYSPQDTATSTSINPGTRILGASYGESGVKNSGLVIDLEPNRPGAYYNLVNDPIYEEVDTEVKHASIKQSSVDEYVTMNAKATIKWENVLSVD